MLLLYNVLLTNGNETVNNHNLKDKKNNTWSVVYINQIYYCPLHVSLL